MKIGTLVSWTHVSQRGRTMSMSLRAGVIDAINGNMATVRKRNGKTEEISIRRLRVEGQPSQLGEFVEAMREAHKSGE
jgi:hypothetical protein